MKLSVSVRGSMGTEDRGLRRPCRYSRMARRSPCEVRGCVCYAGNRRQGSHYTLPKRICLCCIRRLGINAELEYQRMFSASEAEFLEVENEMISRVEALPQRLFAAGDELRGTPQSVRGRPRGR